MDQNAGKMVGIIGDKMGGSEVLGAIPEPKIHLQPGKTKPVRGNLDRVGSALTAEQSATTEKTADGWPILALYERVQLKGIWFIVTRMKLGSGVLGLRMMTTEEVRKEGLKEYSG